MFKRFPQFAILALALALVISPSMCHDDHTEPANIEPEKDASKPVAFFEQNLAGKATLQNTKIEPVNEEKPEEEGEEAKKLRKAEILQTPEIPDFQGYTNDKELVKVPINPHLFSGNNLNIETDNDLLTVIRDHHISSGDISVFKNAKRVLFSSLKYAVVLTKSNTITTVECTGNHKNNGEFSCKANKDTHKLKKDEKVLDISSGDKDGQFLMITAIGKSTAFYMLSATKDHSSRVLEDKNKEEGERATIQGKSVMIDNQPFFVTIREHANSKTIYIYSTSTGKLEDLKNIEHIKIAEFGGEEEEHKHTYMLRINPKTKKISVLKANYKTGHIKINHLILYKENHKYFVKQEEMFASLIGEKHDEKTEIKILNFCELNNSYLLFVKVNGVKKIFSSEPSGNFGHKNYLPHDYGIASLDDFHCPANFGAVVVTGKDHKRREVYAVLKGPTSTQASHNTFIIKKIPKGATLDTVSVIKEDRGLIFFAGEKPSISLEAVNGPLFYLDAKNEIKQKVVITATHIHSGNVEKFTTFLEYTNPHTTTTISLTQDLKVGDNDIEKIAEIKGPVFGAFLKSEIATTPTPTSGSESSPAQKVTIVERIRPKYHIHDGRKSNSFKKPAVGLQKIGTGLFLATTSNADSQNGVVNIFSHDKDLKEKVNYNGKLPNCWIKSNDNFSIQAQKNPATHVLGIFVCDTKSETSKSDKFVVKVGTVQHNDHNDGGDVSLVDLEDVDHKFSCPKTEVKMAKINDDLFPVYLFNSVHNLLEVILLEYNHENHSFSVKGRKLIEKGKFYFLIFQLHPQVSLIKRDMLFQFTLPMPLLLSRAS